MPKIVMAAVCAVAAVAATAATTVLSQPPSEGRAKVSLDNAHVRVYSVRSAGEAGVEHLAGVVVPLVDTPAKKAGDAFWAADVADRAIVPGAAALVVPKETASSGAAPPTATKPGDAPFTGMSFKTLFENNVVAIIRARMEKDAREAFHTHASDTIVVYLSGGAIEDTADGTTKVNHWKHGDIEFEGRGSSHSARNVGDAIDVVLVTLKP